MITIGRRFTMLGVLLLVAGLTGPAMAQNKQALKQQAQALRAAADPIHPNEQILDVNNMTTWLQNDGFFPFIDPFSGVNGSFPKGTAGAVFAQGIVWGGIVRDGKTPEVRVNGSTYATGMQPGKVLRNANGKATGADDPDNLAKYHVWRVHRDWETLDYNAAASQFYGVSPNEVTADQRQTVRDQYAYDWNNWPADLGAPYEDVDGNGSYDPSIDVPGYPGADQTMWVVANDLNSDIAAGLYGSPSIGIEYQLTIWGYDFPQTSPLGNITFARARLIYTGTPGVPDNARIDSMYVVQWADPDVGTYSDDFAGVDTTLSLGYAYNANTRDATYASYGYAPPAVGWDFLQGPINAEGDTLDMTAFVYFAAGSDISDPDLEQYSGTLQWYNLMRGLRPRPEYPAGDPFISPLTGEPSVFTLTGDPVSGSGWIDGQTLPPGDRRLVQATGPFTMELGDTVDVVIGQVGALGSSNLSSVTVLKYHDQYAQFAYDNDFQLPSPPSVPPVTVAELDGEIVLDWSSDLGSLEAIENSENAGFAFEGYNVYQLPSANAPLSEAVKVVTYDKANLISTVFDNVVDEQSGFVIQRPVQTAPNEGLQRYHVITEDHIGSRPLANGVEYHFALTTYSVLQEAGEDAPFRILESSPVVVSVTPQPPQPGQTKSPEVESGYALSHTGPSTSAVQVKVVNPEQLVSGSDYEIAFAYYNPSTGEGVQSLTEGDTLTSVPAGLFEATEWTAPVGVGDPFPLRWQLRRGGSPASGWLPQIDPAGNIPPSAAPIVGGLQIYVPYVQAAIANWELGGGERWVSWTNGGGSGFNGGGFVGHNFFGSTVPPDELPTVVIEFQGPDGDYASEGAIVSRADGYAYVGIGQIPAAAYEIQGDGSKRRLNISFVELDTDDCGNQIWDFGLLTEREECMELGGREYLAIHRSDYDGGQSNVDGANILGSDVYYAIWPAVRGGHPFREDAFTVTFEPAIGLTTNDVYAFEVEGISSGVDSLLTASIEDINVFPNPYLGYSTLEASRYQKFVTFTHLPERATIRIFNLAGTMVRRIDHDSPTQFEKWDLQNQDGIPVASGIYIVHVETDYGDKTLKVALVQEAQILQQY